MEIITHFFSQTFMNIAPFFILLGLLIFVHELGHFLVARWCGVRVETFSLGFGKKIFSYKPGDTNYCLSIIPLGGYVKMFGDDPTAEVPEGEKKFAFLHKRVSQRIAIVLAGPLMNLFFAIFLFMVIARVGEEFPAPLTGDIAENTLAYKSGFRSGDKILKVDDKPVESWLDVQKAVETSPGKPVKFELQHAGHAETSAVTALPELGENENIFSLDKQVGHIDGLTDESTAAVLGVKSGSIAEKAGLQSLDYVVSIDDKPVNSFTDMDAKIKTAIAAQTPNLKLKVRNIEADDKPENHHVVTLPLEGATSTATLGIDNSELFIAKIKPGSPAAMAGLQAKDHIERVAGKEVHTWNDVLNTVKAYTENNPAIEFVTSRAGVMKKSEIKPELSTLMTPKGQEEKRYTIGIVSGAVRMGPDPVLVQVKDPVKIVVIAFKHTWDLSGMMVMSLVRLAQGQVSAKNISGIITIGRVASRSFEIGLSAFLKTMALISINLFMLNLLPVPVLDGGHLLFFSIEALKGTPISLKKLEIAQQVGLTLLMMLMAFAFFNDITNLFTSRW
jgi:regulator of sigma E protease